MKAENQGIPKLSSPATSGQATQDPGSTVDNWRDRLLALSRISAAVSGLQDLDSILRVALDNVLRIMNGSIGGILLLDEKTQTLSYRVWQGLSAKYAEQMRVKLGEGIAGRVAQSGKAVLSEDISLDPRSAQLDLVRAEGLKAFISVPLRSQESILGVINLAGREPHQFTEDDMHLLHSIGDIVGVGIEQARMKERLIKGRERYRRLARQFIIVQEEERRRIARELHDETSQTLSGLALTLQALANIADMSGIGDDEFKAKLKKAHALAVQVHTEVSKLINELRPSLLDTLGLVPAIRQYAQSRLSARGIKVSLETKGSPGPLPSEVESGLFRVAQEAVNNIIRHAHAKNVSIAIEFEPNELSASISDDGQGFDVSQIVGIEDSGRGRGMFGMQERIALLGGKASVKSEPGQGTTVSARIPLVRNGQNAEDKSTGSR